MMGSQQHLWLSNHFLHVRAMNITMNKIITCIYFAASFKTFHLWDGSLAQSPPIIRKAPTANRLTATRGGGVANDWRRLCSLVMCWNEYGMVSAKETEFQCVRK